MEDGGGMDGEREEAGGGPGDDVPDVPDVPDDGSRCAAAGPAAEPIDPILI